MLGREFAFGLRVNYNLPYHTRLFTYLKYSVQMKKIKFSKIRDVNDLARSFGCSKDDFKIIESPSEAVSHYSRMLIPKKNRKNAGSYRVVYKVLNPKLRLLQKNISTALEYACFFPEYVQGFVRGRSIATNARHHLAKKCILNLDIKDFFESISQDRVIRVFEHIGCNSEIASILAKVCTINGYLPQGTSSSPIIANLVCKDMDEELNSLAMSYSINYSRYADDITFSGDACPQREEIEVILGRNNFRMNNEKFVMMKRGQNQYVTGLTVFDAESPRVPRKIKKQLRLILYYSKKYGIEDHLERIFADKVGCPYKKEFEKRKIEGWIGFLCSVEPPLGYKLKEQWLEIVK